VQKFDEIKKGMLFLASLKTDQKRKKKKKERKERDINYCLLFALFPTMKGYALIKID